MPKEAPPIVFIPQIVFIGRETLPWPLPVSLFRFVTVRRGTIAWFTQSPHLAPIISDGYYNETVYIFGLFDGLQRLMITVGEQWYQKSPPYFRVALRSLLSRPSITSVVFSCAGVPPFIILHALLSHKSVALNLFTPFTNQLDSVVDAGIEWPSRTPTGTRRGFFQNVRSLIFDLVESGSLSGLGEVVAACPPPHHLMLDFSSTHYTAGKTSSLELPTMHTLRFLSFKAAGIDEWVLESLMLDVPNLPMCAPGLEVLTFYLGCDRRPRKRGAQSHYPPADEALTTLRHLREAHFILSRESSDGRLASNVRVQLPLSSAAGLLRFSHAKDSRRGWFSYYFSGPYSTMWEGLSHM
ncbi:hypothetical protein B0H19DRAFT_1083671 [Mycena capillaripes]|nr:hypothetical protein B0H19DRAFT_1083671 [Mycena capillaripes]